jgi:RNA polymerase sigma-70 factor (ECF subfamily)
MNALTNQFQPETLPLGLAYNRSEKQSGVEALLQAVLHEDDYGAFEKLFHMTHRSLLAFCQKFVSHRYIAEELVSEVFVKIWKNRKRIIISASGKSYLYTSVRNMAYDHLRKEKKSIWTDLDEAGTLFCNAYNPHQHSEYEEFKARIDQAVAGLPKKCRLIFQLSRDHDMKYHEIAAMLKLSPKTIETQMGRALKVLRANLKDLMYK